MVEQIIGNDQTADRNRSEAPLIKVKNRGKGRHARRQRYAEGKSW